MRGKKYKKLLSWVLCACMIIGVIPSSSLAANTNQQSKTRVETQAKQEKDNTAERAVVLSEQQTENSEDTSSEKESESKSNQKEEKDTSQEDDSESDSEKGDDTEEDTEEQEVTEEEDIEEETTEEAQEATTESAEEEETEEDEDGIALQDLSSGNAAVVAVKLTENENKSVWGKGLITGSEDLDDKSWDKVSDENRGYDSSSSNDIIRSFDSINYNVSSTITMDREEHTLVYEVILPNDPEITLDTKKMNAKEVSSQENGDGTITYTCKYELKKGYAGGEKTENVIVKVGNKHQNDTVRPTIKAYLDENKDSALEVENMETVTVTTAPMYNIVLQKKKNESIVKDVYDFNQKNETGKTYFPDNASKYKDNKVTGYKCTYGFALELRKPGDGIKGVELPDADRDFTFDIDLSKVSLKGKDEEDAKNLVENGFIPLLYYLGPNEPGGGAITEIPFTKQYTGNDLDGTGCLNSGNVSMTQDGTTLHVTVKGFEIDSSQFPKKNYSGTSYWEDINKIREGIFSSYLFQVVYPYINEDGENLQTKLGNGTVNVAATVKNMDAFSEEGTQTTEETNLKDNDQTNTWDMTSGHGRNQQIFYSTRKSMINSYSPDQVRADGDIAAVGADNLAFTVSYVEKNIGEADERADLPVAIDQLVLFDRDAITNVEYSKYMQQSTAEDKYGYNCTVRYGVLKNGGHLDNESMRTAKMEDFTFYNTKPEGGSDAVLVQYRGTNLGSPDMMLHAQFNAEVNNDAELADNVYMITAFTKVWTASDFAEEILKETKKDSLSEVSRKEISDWGKKQDAVKLVENKELVQPVVDNRGYYTVPNYEDGVYKVDENHKFGIYSADALYIVPYTTTITKTVAQLDENGEPQQRYNIGQGQRYVDYKLSNSIRYWGDVTPPKDATTTVYITDTLPDGLTYIEGSAYWDGTYTSNYPQQGSVTGGTQIEPEIVTENGKTILKWAIPEVMLQNGEIPSLYYSCKIGKDVADNANLQGDATIQTNEDKRPILKGNDNISTAAISVTRSNEFYIVKSGGASLELEGKSYYELVAANTSSDDKKDLCIFDTMPYAKGDITANNSKQMKGQYKITALTMDAKEVDHASDMEIWYTNNEEYIGKTAEKISPAEVTESNGWKKAKASGYAGSTITFEGEGLIGDWPTVIAYKDANLEKNTIATLRLEYETPAGAENDEFTNAWSTMSNEKELKSEAKTDVYKRTLEGTVWFDKNQDGKIDEDESKLEGVKVTLYVKNDKGDYVKYTPYNETVEDGTYKSKNAVTYTDENGHYKFTGLPSGDYRVTFESSDGTNLGHYDVTEANADEDKTVTSKVEKKNVSKNGDGELTSGTIKDITMPTIEEMAKEGKKSYNLPDQNLGLTIPKVDISGTKIWKDANNQDGKRPTTIKIRLYADGKEVEEKEAEITVDEDNSNRWNWKFTGLPKYSEEDLKQLTEIKYTVTEDAVENYTTTVDGYKITNTYTPGKVNVGVTKEWSDADNQDGVRPTSIKVHLYADGKDTGEEITITEKGNWSGSFTNLDEYKSGKKIAYTVKEEKVDGYTSEVTGSASTGYVITNTHTPEVTSVEGKKSWKDGDNQDGKRPEKITVRLFADGTEVASKEVTATDNWSWSFTNLPKNAAGKAIAYTVKEDEVEGYTSKVTGDASTGYVITNTHTPEVTSIKGSKTWDDADDQDGKRPEKITVRLLANGKEVAKKEVKADEKQNWSWSFTDLPKYEGGKEIIYTVTEDSVKDYSTTVEGYNITNSYKPGKVSVGVTKAWDDATDQDSKRPESIKVHLYADGKDTGKELTLTEKENWSGSFTDLDEYKSGKKIEYTVKEAEVKDYTSKVTGDADKGYVITNTHTPEVTSVEGKKSWKDGDNQDGKRPEKITVRLFADGTEVASKEVTATDNWSWSFTNLPKNAAGKAIAYTVKEDEVEGYTSKVTGDASTGYVITNTHTPEVTSIKGSKTWDDADDQDGKRPEKITVRLLANGKEVAKKEVKADEKQNWSWSFTDLPKYEGGKEIIYTVTEDSVKDYSTTVEGYNITNSYKPGKVSVGVTKAWDDATDQDSKRPESIKVHLYADGKDTGKELTLTEKENWSGSFTDLDEYKSGKKIEYTVKEAEVKDYTSKVTGDADKGYVITNTHTPEVTSVEGSKTWDDNDNQDGKRPEKITVRLLANGTEVDSEEVTAANDWSWSFTDLPKYAEGAEIIYTVTEDAVENYTTTVDGYDITNSYTPGKVSVLVTKSWNDSNDQDGKRPESITIHLYADGEDTGETLEMTEENNWSGSFTDLDEYKDGVKITYTVEEDVPDGYTASITGDEVQGYVITNTHTSKDKNDFPDKNLDDDGNDGDDGDTDNEESEESSNESESSSGKSNNSNGGSKQTRTGKSAKTGDTSAVAEWIIIFLAAGVIIIALAYERRKSSK